MGTRADFYIGRGPEAEWLGSIAWDGYDISGFKIEESKTAKTFRKRVTAFLASRDDATLPEQGWPWPWDDSTLTDEVYAFDKGQIWNANGYPTPRWYKMSTEGDVEKFKGDEDEQPKRFAKWKAKHEIAKFPNMKDRQAVTMGKRSGLILIGVAQ
jgi:hypothetical protein